MRQGEGQGGSPILARLPYRLTESDFPFLMSNTTDPFCSVAERLPRTNSSRWMAPESPIHLPPNNQFYIYTTVAKLHPPFLPSPPPPPRVSLSLLFHPLYSSFFLSLHINSIDSIPAFCNCDFIQSYTCTTTGPNWLKLCMVSS